MSSVLILQLQGIPSSPNSLSTSKVRDSSSSSSPLLDLTSCSTMGHLKQLHSQIIRFGLSDDNDAMGRLIKFCALSENGDFSYALQLFDKLPQPDAFIYNTLMRGLTLQKGQCYSPDYRAMDPRTSCIFLYSRMLEQPVSPNRFTFPSLIRACSIERGKQVHAHVLKFGFRSDIFTLNNLIRLYVNFQSFEEARMVFDTMLQRDDVTWTTMITGYSRSGFVDKAFQLFKSMPEPKSSASWNAMIASFVQNDRFQEAFALFYKMRSENVAMDKFVAATMLSACTGLGALEQGKWIHKTMEKTGIELDSKLATTIIDMYCKCGSLKNAFRVFNDLPEKGISTWNCMIGGLAMHGKGVAAIMLFEEMEKEKVIPDNITFLNVLTACAHSGLVEKGWYYFHHFPEVHEINPKPEHYGCMVDVLGRAGELEEAGKFITNMPVSPDAGVLGALLGACRIHGNIEMGEEIGKTLLELEPENSGRYVLLANLYAKAGKWEDVAKVRKLMNDRGIKKVAGFSMIELEGSVMEFIAGGGQTQPEAEKIYGKVDEMLESIRCVGYVPISDGLLLLHDDMEGEEEKALSHHSEKLAIAYGLLKTKAGETIRITKNLRVCKDCHEAAKLISKVYVREIIMRDRNRFHHFVGGECSCKDYW